MTETISTANALVGSAWLGTGSTEFDAVNFVAKQVIAGKSFVAMVQVVSVQPGGAGIAGTVSVQPMVNQVDGLGNQMPHGTIFNIPYFRLQGGVAAIIIEPAIGDIGVCVFCDRDISNVKVNRAVSAPGSRRQNDWSDGCYFGGFLGRPTTTWIDLSAGNVQITTPGNVTFNAANAVLDASGNFSCIGTITAGNGTGDQIGLQTHTHTSETAGTPTSAPIAGT
jgi:hypothetical protein